MKYYFNKNIKKDMDAERQTKQITQVGRTEQGKQGHKQVLISDMSNGENQLPDRASLTARFLISLSADNYATASGSSSLRITTGLRNRTKLRDTVSLNTKGSASLKAKVQLKSQTELRDETSPSAREATSPEVIAQLRSQTELRATASPNTRDTISFSSAEVESLQNLYLYRLPPLHLTPMAKFAMAYGRL